MKKALVFSLVGVLGLGVACFAQTLSGSWKTVFTIDPTAPTITIASDITVKYSVGGWSFASTTGLTDTGWDDQIFTVDGSFGMFGLSSSLLFDPSGPSFTSWMAAAGMSFGGVEFRGTFTLVPGVTTLQLVATRTVGMVSTKVTVGFGDGDGCNLDFTGVDIEVGFPFCCAAVVNTIRFNCTGFRDATFAIDDIALPGIDWLTLDALLTFTVEAKTLKVTPSVDFGAVACFEFYLAEVTGGVIDGSGDGPIAIDAFEIVGLGIGCTVGDVEFAGLSYWGDDEGKPDWLGDYWEGYKLSTKDDACCGPFDFSLAVFFDPTATELFTVAEIDAEFGIDIAAQFRFGMTLDLDLLAGTIAWGLVFTVTW